MATHPDLLYADALLNPIYLNLDVLLNEFGYLQQKYP